MDNRISQIVACSIIALHIAIESSYYNAIIGTATNEHDYWYRCAAVAPIATVTTGYCLYKTWTILKKQESHLSKNIVSEGIKGPKIDILAQMHSAQMHSQPNPILVPPRYTALWGAIIGAALGDAIGRFSEFACTQNAIQSALKVDQHSNLSLHALVSDQEMLHCGKLRYTDDTIMAIPVLDACYNGRLNQTTDDAIISALAKGFMYKVSRTNDPYYSIRAHGLTSPRILDQLAKYIQQHGDSGTWWRAGHTTGEIAQKIKQKSVPGCGSVMRVWPIGLIFFDDLPRAKQLAVEQSMITHPLPEASAACAAMVVGMAYALRKMNSVSIIDMMITAAEEYQPYTKQCRLKKKLAWLRNPKQITEKEIKKFKTNFKQHSISVSDMLRYVKKVSQLPADNSLGSPANILGLTSGSTSGKSTNGYFLGWTAGEAVSAAAYIFMRHARGDAAQSWAGIQEAVWTVGDSDSIATLAGALLGAYQGLAFREQKDYTALRYLEDYDYCTNASIQIATLLNAEEPEYVPTPFDTFTTYDRL